MMSSLEASIVAEIVSAGFGSFLFELYVDSASDMASVSIQDLPRCRARSWVLGIAGPNLEPPRKAPDALCGSVGPTSSSSLSSVASDISVGR